MIVTLFIALDQDTSRTINLGSMISAIILAAGKSTRIGVCKQLLKLKGKYMIEYTLDNVKKSNVDEIIVVLGFMASEILKVAV